MKTRNESALAAASSVADVNAISNPEASARRGAIARQLCARITSDQIDIASLLALDDLLTAIENEEPGDDLISRLQRDQFDDSDGTDVVYKRSWNAAMRHAIGVARIMSPRGLDERFDFGGEG